MFKDLRLQHSLSREQLATLTNRSINYILKAEQFTPVTPPTALLEFWTQRGYDRNLLVKEYRDSQRKTRHEWLTAWEPIEPIIPNQPFRRMWVHKTLDSTTHGLSETETRWEYPGQYDSDWQLALQPLPQFIDPNQANQHPTQYALSSGLCLPPAALHRNELNPQRVPSVFLVAMSDLLDFVESGQFSSQQPDADSIALHAGLTAISSILSRAGKKEGVSHGE